MSRVRKERFQQKGYEDRLRREFEQLKMTEEDKYPWNEASILSQREHTGEFPTAPTIGEPNALCGAWTHGKWRRW